MKRAGRGQPYGRTMTVAEMIEKLKKFPQNLEVLDLGMPVEDLKLVEDFPVGDPANPDCEYKSVVIVL